MRITPVKTRPLIPPKDDVLAVLKKALSRQQVRKALGERSILVVTSKIVAIWQGRCIPIDAVKDKDKLIKKEADFYLARKKVPKGWVMLTMKHGVMIPTAGIDESNANGYYILWPEKPFLTAKKIYRFIKKEYKLKKFGVIISDSHTVPLRWGTLGIALAYWGFWPLVDYRGKRDIFGRKLKITQANIADALAAAAVLSMGEGKEQTPIAVITDVRSTITFGNFDFEKKNPLAIERKKDIYSPLLNAIEWQKGGK